MTELMMQAMKDIANNNFFDGQIIAGKDVYADESNCSMDGKVFSGVCRNLQKEGYIDSDKYEGSRVHCFTEKGIKFLIENKIVAKNEYGAYSIIEA